MINLKYTPEQEIELKEGYEAIVGEDDAAYDQRDDFILKFMAKHDKSKKSLVAKMSKMGIYKSRPKVSKVTGEKAETKEQMVAKIARKLGMKVEELEGMDKTPKLTLVRVLRRLEE